LGIRNTIHWMPPIAQPERFAKWSRDVSKLLDYLPHYVAAGRKERVFVIPMGAFAGRGIGFTDMVAFYEQHQMQPFILPDQDQDYEQFIEQLQQLLAINAALAKERQSEATTLSDQKENFEHLRELFRSKGLLRAYYEDYVQIDPELHEKGLFLCKGERGGTNPIPLLGPDKEGEPIVTETEVSFVTEDYGVEFSLSLEELLHNPLNGYTHIGYLAWGCGLDDFIVKAALIRLALHFPDIHVSGDPSDGSPASWWEASLLCQQVFGVGDIPRTVTHWMEYVPDDEA